MDSDSDELVSSGQRVYVYHIYVYSSLSLASAHFQKCSIYWVQLNVNVPVAVSVRAVPKKKKNHTF